MGALRAISQALSRTKSEFQPTYTQKLCVTADRYGSNLLMVAFLLPSKLFFSPDNKYGHSNYSK